MADACGSVWGSIAPKHSTGDITKEFNCVELYIYVIPAKEPERDFNLDNICRNVSIASRIWCENCNIILTVEEKRILTNEAELEKFDLSVQELEDLEAEKIDTSISNFGNDTVDKLVNKFIPETLGPDLSKKIIIYFIQGKKFKPNSAAGHTITQGVPFPVILLNESYIAERIAHEVGHALFSHVNNGLAPNPIQGDPTHSQDPQNLMNPKVQQIPGPVKKNTNYITGRQCSIANSSDLLSNKELKIGYFERYHRYSVKFTKLTCLYSNDGVEAVPYPPFVDEDDTLEAKFEFHVKVQTSIGDGEYTKNYPCKFDEDEGDNNKNKEPNIVIDDAEIRELPTDTIIIEVTGRDDDPDDKFPDVRQKFTINDSWGNNPPPNNIYTLLSEENDHVQYSVEFIITKTGFRDIPHYFEAANICKVREVF
ncbi:hypothetical protein DN392_27825 [Bacillus sp. BB51/4]|uniref:hypothetical protein n=1 Tax=Bacillus sp. BB51/4 TaxID=2217819 RepID=UPI0011EF236D|nr:hypothetical protein [Bacillus sp. BB51/4]KAA0768088.1 hypothetical protein DN392_27825 [Bacillus sp. BB51/4]